MSNMVITYSKRRRKMVKSSKATTSEPDLNPKCAFCSSNEQNDLEYGKIISDESSGLTVHYYCMLFASGLCQRGKSDQDGILGFLAKDIHKEVKRGSRLRCIYCRGKGATIGCVVRSCRKVFHLTCGKRAGSLHQFFDTYRSYCHDHRLKQTVPYSDRLAFFGTANSVCPICLNAVEARTSNDTLRAPCCRNSWFHKQCIQGYASSAGLHFFKCPLCNNNDKFQAEMLTYGICIPDQDAAWEQEPGAYDELLQRYNNCDAPLCRCPQGRSYNHPDSKWELLRCGWCGSSASHKDCGGLRKVRRVLSCGMCAEIDRRGATDTEKKNIQQSGTKRTSSDSLQPSGRQKRHCSSANASASASNQDSSSDEDEDVDVVGVDVEQFNAPGMSSSLPMAPVAQQVQSRRGRRRRGGIQAACPSLPAGTPGPSSMQSLASTSTAVSSETETSAGQPSATFVRNLSNYTVMSHQSVILDEAGRFYCPCQQSTTTAKKDLCIIGRRNEDEEKKTLTIYYSGHTFTINKHKNARDPDVTLAVACQDCGRQQSPTKASPQDAQRKAAAEESSCDEGPPKLVPMQDFRVSAPVNRACTDANSDIGVMWKLYEPDAEATTSDIPDILTDLPSIRITRSASASMASSSDAAEAAAGATADTLQCHTGAGHSGSGSAPGTGSVPADISVDSNQIATDPDSCGVAPDPSSSSPSHSGSASSRSASLRRGSSPQTSSQRLTRSNARCTYKICPVSSGLAPVPEGGPSIQLASSSSSPSRKRPDSVISVSSSDSDVEIEHVSGLPNSYVRLRHWKCTAPSHANHHQHPWRSYMAEAAVNTSLPPRPDRGGPWERVYFPTFQARVPEEVMVLEQMGEKGKCPMTTTHTRRLRSSTPLVISSDTDGEVEVLD